jgi:hypothetical protein
MVRMIAHVRIEGPGLVTRTGEEFQASPREARSLERRGLASRVEASSSSPTAASAPTTPAGDLPADFPHRETLIGLGLTTLAAVRGAKALGRRKGMGPARAADVAAALEE